ncbi:MAG: peptidylprolyl isomerase, partial [Pseudomonadota bacterium]|nr:peptidylprolyl isomerase [Pseudomonadota bacterium]
MRNLIFLRLATRYLRLIPITALAIMGCFTAANVAYGQRDVVRIAAIVNDEIISGFDLENRVRLVATSTNSSKSPAALRRLAPQVLRQMIDERIQLHEAKKLNVRVSSREINGTIANLERQSGLRPGQIWTVLRSNNVDRSALEFQIRAKISWLKLVNRRIRRQISVGQEEINEEIARLKSLQGKPRLQVQEIFLSVDSPDLEQQTRQTANRLVSQILNGVNFEGLAREFSQSTTAGRGGRLGWITDSEIDQELTTALSVMQPGQVSRPIRTLTGYYILFLANRQAGKSGDVNDLSVKYRQMTAPVTSGAP